MVAPDIDVTPELARRLLDRQHPDLAGLPIRLVANGWDNAMLRLGDDLAIRMPRREAAAHLLRHEQDWLPVLAPRLPVAVPVPIRVGMPDREYRWPWSVVPWHRGRALVDVPAAERRALAPHLAVFHRAIHEPAPRDAPRNPFRDQPLATRAAALRRRIDAGIVPDGERVASMFDDALGAEPWGGPRVWIHGDPHPGNLVALDEGGLAVLDFGDLTAGDPATDLAAAWLVFDAEGRRAYREALGDVHRADDPVWLRARGWALSMAAALLESTAEDAWLIRLGQEALTEALSEV